VAALEMWILLHFWWASTDSPAHRKQGITAVKGLREYEICSEDDSTVGFCFHLLETGD
jgi:hypothetical protein